MPLRLPQPRLATTDSRRLKALGEDRGGSTARAVPYDAAWRKLRRRHLQQHPLCADCEERGQITPAKHVDHVEPIVRAPARRLDPTNLRSLCHSCQSRKTASEQALWER